MSQNNRVFITGLGAMTALAINVDDTWNNILDGQSGIGEVSQWDLSEFPFTKGAEIQNYRARDLVKDRKLLKMISRFEVIGLNAATQAVEHSGIPSFQAELENAEKFNDRTGVYVASPGNKFFQQYDFMPLLAKAQKDMTVFADNLFDEIHPMWLLKTLPNNVLAYTGIQHGFKGPNQNITNHVVGGMQAFIEAFYAIKTGQADRAVVVAYDIGFEPQAQRYYGQLGILSNDALRSFDAKHNGTILGEGAAAIVLESEASCEARQAKKYSEVLAGKTAGDAQGIFSVDEQSQGLMNLMGDLFEASNHQYQDLGMLTAHANGNTKSDVTESLAYHELFRDTPITGFKWALGHTLTASGLLDIVMTVKSLEHNIVPGIQAFDELSSSCQEINVDKQPKSLEKPLAAVVNRGFGGLNATTLLKACE